MDVTEALGRSIEEWQTKVDTVQPEQWTAATPWSRTYM